jgi:hypothetical protein
VLSSDEVRTGFVSGLTFGPRAVQYAVVDGRAIFKGDIDLGSVEEVEKSNAVMRGAGLEEAVVLPGSQFRWPNGTVPLPVARRPVVPAGPGGLSPFLLATGRHAAVGDVQGAAGDALEAATAAVAEARRNVVALQTALTAATSELARAQEHYDAVVTSIPSMG